MFVGARWERGGWYQVGNHGTPIAFSWALRRAAWSLYCDALVAITSEGPKACKFVAADELLVPQLIVLRKTGLSETDQCTTQQGVAWIPAYPPLSRAPVCSNSVTSGLAEIDPVLRAPLPQNCFLGLVRKIVPPFEGAAPRQQILISAVSTSSTEDVANFVVIDG